MKLSLLLGLIFSLLAGTIATRNEFDHTYTTMPTSIWQQRKLTLNTTETVDRSIHRRLLKATKPEDIDPAFLASRRRLQDAVDSRPVHEHHEHNVAWKKYEMVDGIHNREVAIFVTSTTTNGMHFLWDRIIPSAKTWMKDFARVFVIIEDNFAVRYALRQCHVIEHPHYTTFSCRNEPVYLLSRTCDNSYYGPPGPCCKVDEMINFLANDRHSDLFKEIKYVFHADDDTYFRAEPLLRWVAALDNSGLGALPLTANDKKSHIHGVDTDSVGGVWHIEHCKDLETGGWYQPLMLNHWALEKMRVAAASYGVRDTCREFDVTHDVGFGVFVWLFELLHVRLPKTEINPGHKGVEIFQPDQVIVHCLKPDNEDKCADEKNWPADKRYNQTFVVGCGDAAGGGLHSPFHNEKKRADMYDMHAYFQQHGADIRFGELGKHNFVEHLVTFEPTPAPDGKPRIRDVLRHDEKPDQDNKYKGLEVKKVVMPEVGYLPGYRATEHAKKYDITKEWHKFKMEDCTDKGSIKKRDLPYP